MGQVASDINPISVLAKAVASMCHDCTKFVLNSCESECDCCCSCWRFGFHTYKISDSDSDSEPTLCCGEWHNPDYWTFSLFLLRVKNVAFCLCFGLFHSLEICCNFVGISLDWALELTIQPTELFFDESSLLNFFLVFAACEKHVILLMFWLVWHVKNLSEIRRIAWSTTKMGRAAFCPEAFSWVLWAFLVGIYDGYVYKYIWSWACAVNCNPAPFRQLSR